MLDLKIQQRTKIIQDRHQEVLRALERYEPRFIFKKESLISEVVSACQKSKIMLAMKRTLLK